MSVFVLDGVQAKGAEPDFELASGRGRPWGRIVGATQEKLQRLGELFLFGRNAMSAGEFAGATFSPDGSTLFVNMQEDGLTVAITGDWGKFQAV